MSTIPKERLEQLASGNAWYCVQDDEAAELARIALASLEAEPVVYMWDSERKDIDAPGYYRAEHLVFAESSVKQWGGRVVPLYTAPPAPVSVPAAMEMDDDFDSAFEHGKAVGWNACRAAMLQSQGNCIKDGWISCSDRMPEDTKMLLAFSQGEIVAAYLNWVVNPIDYKKYRAFTYLSGNILDDVTHWMPLPEPPL